MNRESNFEKLKSVRVGEIGRIFRRILGLPYLREEDFLFEVTMAEANRMQEMSRRARGDGPAPVLVLGVMPRSGTNFVRDLIAMHPEIHADPEQVHEFPLLHVASEARVFMRKFFLSFPSNAQTLSQWDSLALLAGAWFRNWQDEAGDKHILLKCPHVHHLSLAPYIYPDTKVILCVRDGRDVVDSTLRTFPRFSLRRKTFGQLAHEWRLGTEAIYTFREGAKNANENVLVVRYEDIYANPEMGVTQLLNHIGLPLDTYPMHEVEALPVRGSSRSSADNSKRWLPEAKTPDFNPVKRWSNWSASRRSRFERLAGRSLKVAGYDP